LKPTAYKIKKIIS